MKCKELMIGDWFNFLINVEGGDTEFAPKNEIRQPMRVACLDANGVSSEEGVVNYPIQLQPIPLNTEIIEKNFEQLDMEGEYFGFYDEYYEIEVSEYTDGIWEVKIDEIEMGGLPSWRMYVSNVHELQHAIRLCNIEKEIRL